MLTQYHVYGYNVPEPARLLYAVPFLLLPQKGAYTVPVLVFLER